MPSREDNLLVRAVARAPTTVNRKLLAAFVGLVGLLVVVGVLGLRVLGASNNRVETLGSSEQRLASYRELKTDAGDVRLLLALRVVGGDINAYVGATPGPSAATNVGSNDDALQSTIKLLGSKTDASQLGFEPPPDEKRLLDQIHQAFGLLSVAANQVFALDQKGSAIPSGLIQSVEADTNNLVTLSTQLVTTTDDAATTLIAQNQTSYVDSQHLFIGVAAGSVLLALLLGFVLSWSLVGPIRRMGARLEAIAAGDFAGHVEVPNRDELGALASNLNRMNDELGRVYGELETASRHKSEFLANMSHELRTPLNAIIGFSQVLKQRMAGDLNGKQAEYVDDILESGQHLLSLINDVLDLAKVESGRMELQPSTFDLGHAVENATAMVRERATRQGVGIALDVDEELGSIDADERKIKQVLFNLLSNAVKFTPAGGLVTVRTGTDGTSARISVQDTGIGIDEEHLAEVFEEFRQLKPGRAQEGTGLGLPIAKRLVKLHHGDLTVVSTPGIGSTFTVTLPLRQEILSADGAPPIPEAAVTG